MKKILSVLLTALLLVSLAASAFTEDGDAVDCSRSGIMIPKTAAVASHSENVVERPGGVVCHDPIITEVELRYFPADLIHENNIKRTIRALEFHRQTGQKISVHNALEKARMSPYNFAYFVLNDDREKVYDRINRRVDLMMEEGLEEEVRSLYRKGLRRDMVSMQGLGYREMLAYLDGETDSAEAVRLIKRNTRHFAKRQLTWFRRERDVIWMNRQDYPDGDSAILREMIRILEEKEIIPLQP